MQKKKVWPLVLTALLFLSAILTGALLGLACAETKNIKNIENFTEIETALGTRLVDINGELITEFSSDEKREIIALNDLPQHMIDALLTREDRIFYEHHGFSVKALTRAVIGVLTHKSLGGGSTLTQQIAGTLYCNRSEASIKRKLKELWWAIQMERRYSKNEILEIYLNKIYFGGGTYGVNAASKYYFGHSAKEITPAEAAILVIQLSNPAYYNPFENTNRAMDRQKDVLDAMVASSLLTKEEAEKSFNDFWANFDYTRTSASAYVLREDKAPWFSEYVRRNLSGMLYGTEDLYTGGFTVNTTLNLEHQKAAEDIMAAYIRYANRQYQRSSSARLSDASKVYVPMTDLLSLVFNMPSLRVGEQRNQNISMNEYTNNIAPVVDVMSMMFGMDTLKTGIVNHTNTLRKKNAEKTTIEGTMIALENDTGYIDALVGGSKYDSENQFIRAVQSKLQPGSTIKPLYYSAAIDSKNFTMTSIISDTPIVFHKEDGSPYIPQNFKGEWKGNVEFWYALAHSMNVPSLKILDGIGFSAAISRAASLYGIPQNELEERNFEPVYPFGLGVCAVRPVEVARAFATFANNGKGVSPIAIRNVEDKDGNIILNPEKDLRMEQQRAANGNQIVSQETAFIMKQLLSKTVESGTLSYGSGWDSSSWTTGRDNGRRGSKFTFTDENGKKFDMPAAGKTGTTQNWADAWAVGFTPYYTAAFWFGFDRPGQSLGLSLTGSTLAGVAWGEFMNAANQGKPYKSFGEAPSTLIELDACDESGQKWSEDCGENHKITAYYYPGTEPSDFCEKHSGNTINIAYSLKRLMKERYQSGYDFNFNDDSTLSLDLGFLESPLTSAEYLENEGNRTYNKNTAEEKLTIPVKGNKFLD